MLQDAGFQKYLIQHSFPSNKELYGYATVAFWTNAAVAIAACIILVINCNVISAGLGIPGKGVALAAASFSLPLSSLCSVQTALFQRKLDFKSLFVMRIVSACIPLVITLPLAVVGLGFWSLIFGTLAGKLFNAFILTIRSEWHPVFQYSFSYLRCMWSFSFWTLLESISIWLTSWIGVFIIGANMHEYYVGLYNNSTAVVNSVVAIVSSSVVSVLISTLSKIQDNKDAFLEYFLKYQKAVAFIVFLMGSLFLSFGHTVTELLLGSNWSEASILVSLWGASSALVVPFANFGSVAYVSLGKPRVSFFVQTAYIMVLAPVIYLSSIQGFEELSIASASCRLAFVAIHLFAMKVFIQLPLKPMMRNVANYYWFNMVLSSGVLIMRAIFGWHIVVDLITAPLYILIYFIAFRKDGVVMGFLSSLKNWSGFNC